MQKASTPSCSVHDKLNGMIREAFRKFCFPGNVINVSLATYQLQFYISRSICTCYVQLTYRHSKDFGERKSVKIKKNQSAANSVTRRRHEQILFRDFEKQLAEDYRTKRPLLAVPGKYFAHLMPSKLSLCLNFSPSD